MPVEQDDREGLRQREPNIRPLGLIAVGFAALSALFALSVVLSPLAFLPAAIAIPLGFITRRDQPTRAMGNATLFITSGAVIWATCMLFVLFDDSFGY